MLRARHAVHTIGASRFQLHIHTILIVNIGTALSRHSAGLMTFETVARLGYVPRHDKCHQSWCTGVSSTSPSRSQETISMKGARPSPLSCGRFIRSRSTVASRMHCCAGLSRACSKASGFDCAHSRRISGWYDIQAASCPSLGHPASTSSCLGLDRTFNFFKDSFT